VFLTSRDEDITDARLAQLAAFATGKLSATAFERVAQHVEGCPACETALGALDAHADSFLSRLRQLADQQPPAGDVVPGELMAVARSSLSDSPDEGPRRIGKFELLEELGLGSFGHVFRARDTELGRIVAIKLLRAGRLASREEVDRFIREARSAAQLDPMRRTALYPVARALALRGNIEGFDRTMASIHRIDHRMILEDVSLQARVGDTISIGNADFVIAGVIDRIPGDVGVTAVVAKERVHLHELHLLERFGPLAIVVEGVLRRQCGDDLANVPVELPIQFEQFVLCQKLPHDDETITVESSFRLFVIHRTSKTFASSFPSSAWERHFHTLKAFHSIAQGIPMCRDTLG
jgi:hypothetical protein